MDELIKGVNKIEDSWMTFKFNKAKATSKWRCQLVDASTPEALEEAKKNEAKEVTAFLFGDLAFLFTIFGREPRELFWILVLPLQTVEERVAAFRFQY